MKTNELREACIDSWRAALRMSVRDGVVHMSHQSFAGYLLRTHGSARAAIDNCPPEPWFNPVRDMLARVAEEDARSAPATVIQLFPHQEEEFHVVDA